MYHGNEIVSQNNNVTISNKNLVSGISDEMLEKLSKYYSIPKLQFPFTIKINDENIGIIGLSNLIWANRRANLNILLDKELNYNIIMRKLPGIINRYIEYVHKLNVYNVMFEVNGSNENMIKSMLLSEMKYCGLIPFGACSENSIESKYMFQHVPDMEQRYGIIIPDNKSILISLLDTKKKEIEEYIELQNRFKLISPRILKKEKISVDSVLAGHIKAMQNREKFAIPLGEDKYMLQKGNENYGIFKAFMNYTYIILDEKNNYAGYINILRTNANGKNAEIEIGVNPMIQHKGLGTMVINRFYDELFSVGYASVTSAVFEFNIPSLKLHEKVAKLDGVRLDSYYINGKLWNVNYYSKINDLISKALNIKHI